MKCICRQNLSVIYFSATIFSHHVLYHLPEFILAPQCRGGEKFSFRTSQESSVSRIREGPFPRTNVLALKHLDLHKGQPAKRELGPPKRAGLGKVPRLRKGPQSETWLCSGSTTRAPPSAGSGLDCQREGKKQPLSTQAPSSIPTSLSPINWGIQMSQQLSKGNELRGC